MKDMITMNAHSLAQIVYAEKQREKFDITLSDQMTGLEIFSAQGNINEFSEIFTKVITDEGDFSNEDFEQLVKNISTFSNEKDKPRRLEMAYKTFRKVFESGSVFGPVVFDRLVFMFTEA